jgi:hypothetical protein
VIVGNPPYVEYSKVRKSYQVSDSYTTITCGNLYALATERSYSLLSTKGWFSLIVPLSLVCTTRSSALREVLNDRELWLSNFDMRPSSLFEGVAQRLSIFVAGPEVSVSRIYAAGYRRWSVTERSSLMANTVFSKGIPISGTGSYPKIQGSIEASILAKQPRQTLATLRTKSGKSPIFLHRIVRYYIKAISFEPHFVGADGKAGRSDDYKVFQFPAASREVIASFLNSTLFYWLWRVSGDGFHCGYGDVDETPFKLPLEAGNSDKIISVYKDLMVGLRKNSVTKRIKTKAGSIEYQGFSISPLKPLIDEIDTILAKHYGFTEEELDFIINYDIKYRMGLGGGSAEEDEG